jgi:hypothetical protein
MERNFALARKLNGDKLIPVLFSGTPTKLMNEVYITARGMMVPLPVLPRGLDRDYIVMEEFEECADFIKALLREFPENVSLMYECLQTGNLHHRLFPTAMLIDYLMNNEL